jgi:hypothetical protein
VYEEAYADDGLSGVNGDEVRRVSQTFRATYSARDQALLVLDVKAGFRGSESLNLRVGDV